MIVGQNFEEILDRLVAVKESSLATDENITRPRRHSHNVKSGSKSVRFRFHILSRSIIPLCAGPNSIFRCDCQGHRVEKCRIEMDMTPSMSDALLYEPEMTKNLTALRLRETRSPVSFSSSGFDSKFKASQTTQLVTRRSTQ